MSPEFGTERSIIKTFRFGDEVQELKHYKVRVKVNSAEEEMTEFIKFTKELADLRDKIIDTGDPTLKASFSFEYPKDAKSGEHFIIKSYTILA